MSKAEEYLKKSICKCQEGDRPYNEWVSTDCAKLAIDIAREETVEKALTTFQVVCNRPAKLLPNCETYCNACKQFKQTLKDE